MPKHNMKSRRTNISPELAQKIREAVARRKTENLIFETTVETTFKMKVKSLLKILGGMAGNKIVIMFCWGLLVGFLMSHI